jgi:hypothetical protein
MLKRGPCKVGFVVKQSPAPFIIASKGVTQDMSLIVNSRLSIPINQTSHEKPDINANYIAHMHVIIV